MQSISEMFTPNSNCTRPRIESWSKRVKNFRLFSTFLSKILSFNSSAMRHSKDTFKELNEYRYEMKVTMKFAKSK